MYLIEHYENRKHKEILIGFIIAFIFFTIMDTGVKRKPLFFNSIIIKYMNQKYHIHHWITFLILLLILLFMLVRNNNIFGYGYTNIKAIMLGICLGSITQGLTYNDAFDIIIK